MGEFTNADLALGLNEHEGSEASRVGQDAEECVRLHGVEYICQALYMYRHIYDHGSQREAVP